MTIDNLLINYKTQLFWLDLLLNTIFTRRRNLGIVKCFVNFTHKKFLDFIFFGLILINLTDIYIIRWSNDIDLSTIPQIA